MNNNLNNSVNTDFKAHYLTTSNESINRKEDRMVNREIRDPYRYEKKMQSVYERESNMNKYNLNSIKIDASLNTDNFSQEKNLHYNYDEFTGNRYKRKPINTEMNESNNMEEDTSKKRKSKNTRYDRVTSTGENFNRNERIANSDSFANNVNVGNNTNINTGGFNNNALNNELKYYRDVIDKMHSEISNLNTKLTDIEKNNKVGQNSANSHNNANSYTHSNSNLSTAHFKSHRLDNSNSNSNTNSNVDINTIKTKDERQILAKMENDRQYLYNKNKEMEQAINKLDNYASLQQNDNNDITNITNITNPVSEISKTNNRNKNVERSNSADKPRKRTASKTNKNNQTRSTTPAKNNKNIIKQPQQIKKSQSKPKLNTIDTNQNSGSIQAVLTENENLKNKINQLEKTVKFLNDQIGLDNIEKKGKDHLRVELEIWRNRSDSLAQNYLETLTQLKKQLINDKANYVSQIKSMQNHFTTQVNSVKNKYQSTLEKYEINIKKLRRENDELKKKLSKVKEIINPDK